MREDTKYYTDAGKGPYLTKRECEDAEKGPTMRKLVFASAAALMLAASLPASAQYMGNDGYQGQRDGRSGRNSGDAMGDEIRERLRALDRAMRESGFFSGLRSPNRAEREGRHPRQ